MAKVNVIFDNKLKQSDIIIPLTNTSEQEIGEENYEDNKQEIQQTAIYGIQAPLIMVNNTVIDFTDIVDFELKSTGLLPALQMTVTDRKHIIQQVDTPGIDNEVRIQILPKFDDKYKKINLTFYIQTMNFDGDQIEISGVYKSPKLRSSNMKSFGKLNTYQFFSQVAKDTQLGFASNISANSADARYIYCDNKSFMDAMDNEIKYSGSDKQLLDYWIDLWNNLVLVDIYERYNTIEPEDKIQVWVANVNNNAEEGVDIEPMQAPAIFNNHPANQSSELFVNNYNIISRTGAAVSGGTDCIYSIYDISQGEYLDYLIMDGDVQKDAHIQMVYVGETYDSFNYFIQSKKRESFLRKISSNETIEIETSTPFLGIMRGDKVNFVWYVNNSNAEILTESLNEQGVTDQESASAASSIPLETTEIPEGEEVPDQGGTWTPDPSISGQYMVKGVTYKFQDQEWTYVLTLSRPYSEKPYIINQENQNE